MAGAAVVALCHQGRARARDRSPTTKRGPKTAQSDGEVVALIRHPTDVLRFATGHEVGDTPRPPDRELATSADLGHAAAFSMPPRVTSIERLAELREELTEAKL